MILRTTMPISERDRRWRLHLIWRDERGGLFLPAASSQSLAPKKGLAA
ncbi:MAG TPA: hypothetical protein VHI51_04050 [Ktedonobacterales bacterium]|nr:hypothetical protein [Ktedonobacterales bacterium]